MDCFICGPPEKLHIGTIVTYIWMICVTCLDHCYISGLCVLHMWQSSWPASFSPAGLTLWPNWLECWLATVSRLSTQVRIPVGLSVPGRYIGGLSVGLGKAQRIDSSLRADWLSCFSPAWWEWRVARQGCLVPLRKWGMWQSSWPASFSPAGLTLWLNWLEPWLATLNTSGVAGAGTLHISGWPWHMWMMIVTYPNDCLKSVRWMVTYLHITGRTVRFPLPDSPGQVKLPVGQADLDRFFFFISYKQIEEFQKLLESGKWWFWEKASPAQAFWMMMSLSHLLKIIWQLQEVCLCLQIEWNGTCGTIVRLLTFLMIADVLMWPAHLYTVIRFTDLYTVRARHNGRHLAIDIFKGIFLM